MDLEFRQSNNVCPLREEGGCESRRKGFTSFEEIHPILTFRQARAARGARRQLSSRLYSAIHPLSHNVLPAAVPIYRDGLEYVAPWLLYPTYYLLLAVGGS